MSTIKEIREYVEEKGRGTAFYNYVNTEPVYLSKGIRKAFLDGGDIQEVINAVGRFQKKDFGTADNTAAKPGHEYGVYESSVEAVEAEDPSIHVHRDRENVIVFFGFER